MKRLFPRLSKALILGFFIAGALVSSQLIFSPLPYEFYSNETLAILSGVALLGLAFYIPNYFIRVGIDNKVLKLIAAAVVGIPSGLVLGTLPLFAFHDLLDGKANGEEVS
ncbi:MAG: hypothetical protein AAGA62_17615, partial [Bacteroidota bacterium]